ncbi:DUF3604 domain-containing protein [Phenylobacterium sp. LjRoot225]|uniref:DUF3604 domain-containing protein n=1 Tax=Phenylobacterium sp. LjRoot225 TaxID=3342285 RepID=UPI003ECD49F7
MKRLRLLLVSSAAVAGVLGGVNLFAASKPVAGRPPPPAIVAAAHATENDPSDRRAFFGELHLHTGQSFDAYSLMGARSTPDEAYRFARGEPITYLGQTVQRPRPLDFTAVTDHAEYMGVLNQLDDADSPLAKSDLGKLFLQSPGKGFLALIGRLSKGEDPPELNAKAAMSRTWAAEVDAANNNYQPGKFTTLIAYEWTAMPDRKNLHRNVIFRNAPPAAPFSSSASERPEDLWSYLERLRGQGIEALAIPHNANASGGLMFDWNDSDHRPISEDYAQRRALNEPLTELFQTKGQSETAPELSPNDEFSNFEVMEQLLTGGPSAVNGSYARQALGRGLVVQSKVGTNPFKLGFVGSSDFHGGLSNADENAYAGQGGLGIDPKVNLPSRELAQKLLAPGETRRPSIEERAKGGAESELNAHGIYGSAGLTGVWAERNTRESIYAALRRKETFATSGPTIRLRFFGGWNVQANALARPDWVATAYRTDVAMGGDLPARPQAAAAPGFIVEAARDPTSGNLDRIQIVKVWLDGDAYREKVFDVVWSPERKRDPKTGKPPPVRNTVDLKTAAYSNTVGAPLLRGVWRDPDFDPKAPAVYYARAIEIPTPRWSTILAVKRNLPLPPHLPATIQERAVSSPIWYTPQRIGRRSDTGVRTPS